MRRLNILMFFSMISGIIHAQFVNNGATVTIQAGATLRVETDFINNTGTVTNNGTLEVQGNFTNSATFTSANPSLVKFIGTGASNVTSGTAVFRNVEMAKTANDVVLASNMSIAGDLNFSADDNQVTLGAFNLNMLTGATVTSPDANEYVATTGAGSMIKNIVGNSTVVHEIGNASNYSPLSSVVTGTGYSSATLGARVYTSGLQPKYTEASDLIAREWNVVATGITTYANTMTGTYVAGDVTGSQSLIKGSTYHTGDWRFDGSNNAALQVIASTTTNDVKFSGQNFFGKTNLKAYLQGPYNPSTGLMSTGLNAPTGTNHLETSALISPYLDAPASVSAGFFLANPTIVDWVKLELRDPSAPSTSTAHKASAFIKSNGDIVGLDGTSLPRIKNGFPTSVVVLSHRNHLSIRTVNAGLNVVNPPSQHDFSANMANCFNSTSAPSNTNTPQKVITGGFPTNAMWAGDVNANGQVKYNLGSNDRVLILNQVGASTPNNTVDGYFATDVSMNGQVKYNLGGNDRVIMLNNVGSTTPNNIIYNHN